MLTFCDFREKFGLYYVNYSDPARPRIAKDSSRVMAEIIRTRHLPPQKYAEEDDTEKGLLHDELHHNVKEDIDLGSLEESRFTTRITKENVQEGEMEFDVPNVRNSEEITEELGIQKEILIVVGINED
jgi:hypothetical protein